jgi:hypothetical protein
MRLEQSGSVVPDIVCHPIDRPDPQPVGGEGMQQRRHIAILFTEPDWPVRRLDETISDFILAGYSDASAILLRPSLAAAGRLGSLFRPSRKSAFSANECRK